MVKQRLIMLPKCPLWGMEFFEVTIWVYRERQSPFLAKGIYCLWIEKEILLQFGIFVSIVLISPEWLPDSPLYKLKLIICWRCEFQLAPLPSVALEVKIGAEQSRETAFSGCTTLAPLYSDLTTLN
jgi:hypothetical protein